VPALCTNDQLASGQWVNSPQGCYMLTPSSTSYVSFSSGDPLPSIAPDTCMNANGAEYACAVTNCGDTGQPLCAGVPMGTCLDADGNVRTCTGSNGFGPPSLKCWCSNGQPACMDSVTGQSIPFSEASADFGLTVGDICGESSGNGNSQGGYYCADDGTCQYNAAGGPYGDSTCDDACLPDSGN